MALKGERTEIEDMDAKEQDSKRFYDKITSKMTPETKQSLNECLLSTMKTEKKYQNVYWICSHDCVQLLITIISDGNKANNIDCFNLHYIQKIIEKAQNEGQYNGYKINVELLSTKKQFDKIMIWDQDQGYPVTCLEDECICNVIHKYSDSLWQCPLNEVIGKPLFQLCNLCTMSQHKLSKLIWNLMIDNINKGTYSFEFIYFTCYFQTFFIDEYVVHLIFSKSNGLKALFENLLSKSIANRNIYSLILVSRFLNFIISNVPRISRYIFHGKSQLYKKLFIFWKRYMQFYWNRKQQFKSKSSFAKLKTLIDKTTILPLIVYTVEHQFNHEINLYLIRNKYFLYEWLLDLIAGILTKTIEQSRYYWLNGPKEMKIMRYLLRKKNCQFFAEWLIKQYQTIRFYILTAKSKLALSLALERVLLEHWNRFTLAIEAAWQEQTNIKVHYKTLPCGTPH